MLIEGEAIRALLPHRGAMCLIDIVERCDEASISCTTRQHLHADNPLRRRGRLSIVHAIEFAAQAAALHAALTLPSTPSPRAGLLVSVRHCALHASALDRDGGALTIEARRSAHSATFSTYEFGVDAANGRLASGRIGVYFEGMAGR